MRSLLSSSLTLLLLGLMSISCASSSTIRSTDPEAKIYIDGEYKGKGDTLHTDTKIVGSMTHVRIEKPGCESKTFNFYRNEEFDVGACIGGIFVLVPFLWIMRYKPEHNYEYTCNALKGSASNTSQNAAKISKVSSNSKKHPTL